jgi:hypothetical protein
VKPDEWGTDDDVGGRPFAGGMRDRRLAARPEMILFCRSYAALSATLG